MSSGLNVIQRDSLLRKIARMQGEINLVRALLQGRPIDTVRIADLAVTNAKIADLAVDDAKIADLSADKITAGDLIVAVNVGESITGFVRLDGVNNRMIVHNGTTNRIVIGDV